MPAVSPEAKANEAAYKKRWRQGRIDTYLAEHGNPPKCGCGCGGHVKFDQNGIPRTYMHNHQPKPGLALGPKVKPGSRPLDELIPIEQFRELMWKIKNERGLTWPQLAEMGGISSTHLRTLIYKNSKKHVGKEWLSNLLARMSGLPAPASTYQKRQMTLSNRRHAATRQD
jgi:hypothetical protein